MSQNERTLPTPPRRFWPSAVSIEEASVGEVVLAEHLTLQGSPRERHEARVEEFIRGTTTAESREYWLDRVRRDGFPALAMRIAHSGRS